MFPVLEVQPGLCTVQQSRNVLMEGNAIKTTSIRGHFYVVSHEIQTVETGNIHTALQFPVRSTATLCIA